MHKAVVYLAISEEESWLVLNKDNDSVAKNVLSWLFFSLQSLSFQQVQHSISTIDVQLTVDGGLIVFVVGQLKVSLKTA